MLVKKSAGMRGKECPVCGRTFWHYPSNFEKYVTCSLKCRRIHKTQGGTHKMSRTRLYGIWCGMKRRCYCESSPAYAYYGARGIRVCDEWRHDFAGFQTWATANGYAEHLEIDRIDVNGDYGPSNCRWATRHQQMANTRKRRDAQTSKYRGVSRHNPSGRWIAQGHNNGRPVYLGLFDSEEEAAHAYDDFARQKWGEFARLNFKEGKVCHVSPQ